MSHEQDQTADLFTTADTQPDASLTPLAARMRPQSFEDFIGQDEIVGLECPLRKAIEAAAVAFEERRPSAARLIAVAVRFQAGQASPAMIELATETASAQGWRRPLLAWLQVQALRAEKAGDAAALAALQRRIALVRLGLR